MISENRKPALIPGGFSLCVSMMRLRGPYAMMFISQNRNSACVSRIIGTPTVK